MKNSKHGILTEMEQEFLDNLISLSFNSLCIDSKFVSYLINESDFIEILMSDITNQLELLPNELEPYDILGNYNLVEQLRNSSELLLNQYDSLITACKKIY